MCALAALCWLPGIISFVMVDVSNSQVCAAFHTITRDSELKRQHLLSLLMVGFTVSSSIVAATHNKSCRQGEP